VKTLLLIDIQNDFMPGGALAVARGDEIIPVINDLMPSFDLIVATQDWHPADHGSFAVNHPGHSLFETIDLDGLSQTLWPVHCVQNTGGALFAPGLDTRRIEKVFPKGQNPRIDSYSGFFDNGHRATTGMDDWLKSRGVQRLSVAGVATDYCVKFTVLDALAAGFEVEVLTSACRAVNLAPCDDARALAAMKSAGANLVGDIP
jgi:nicotinamidase/pyrazinamidase